MDGSSVPDAAHTHLRRAQAPFHHTEPTSVDLQQLLAHVLAAVNNRVSVAGMFLKPS